MGALIGLLFGAGLCLALTSGRPPRLRSGPSWQQRRSEVLAQAGLAELRPAQLVMLQFAAAALAFIVVLAVSRTLSLAVAFGLLAGYAPWSLVVSRRRRRSRDLRELWPEVVDNLGSGVRAGLGLPEALSAIGERGPEQLRPSFARFGADYRATGRFGESLDRLKVDLADPVGDRVCESLRMAREVGGNDLGRLLRTLSDFLREDARVRSELETRQGWTVNAARLAVAAPWLVLLLLATQSSTVAAYDQGVGPLILLGGAGVCLLAYRLMVLIGRLPEERRVLR